MVTPRLVPCEVRGGDMAVRGWQQRPWRRPSLLPSAAAVRAFPSRTRAAFLGPLDWPGSPVFLGPLGRPGSPVSLGPLGRPGLSPGGHTVGSGGGLPTSYAPSGEMAPTVSGGGVGGASAVTASGEGGGVVLGGGGGSNRWGADGRAGGSSFHRPRPPHDRHGSGGDGRSAVGAPAVNKAVSFAVE